MQKESVQIAPSNSHTVTKRVGVGQSLLQKNEATKQLRTKQGSETTPINDDRTNELAMITLFALLCASSS